jgi:hypothetical protein
MALSIKDKDLEISPGWTAYIIAISALYLIYGLLQFYDGIVDWWLPWLGNEVQLGIKVLDTYIPNTFPDPFSGLSLVIVGLLLLRATQLYRSNHVKGLGFLFVGWLLATILMTLNALVIFADILDAYYPLVWGESVEGWTLASDAWGVAPHLLIGILALPIYWSTKGIKEIIRGLKPK